MPRPSRSGGEAKDASSRELLGEAEGATVTTTMIEVQPGGNTLSYTHHGEHAVYILEGSGVIDEENGVSPLNARCPVPKFTNS